MKNVTIHNEEDFITPIKVQEVVKNMFVMKTAKDVEIRFDDKIKCYDVYINDKFVCSFDSDGENI